MVLKDGRAGGLGDVKESGPGSRRACQLGTFRPTPTGLISLNVPGIKTRYVSRKMSDEPPTEEKPRRGGARPGAGRKPGPNAPQVRVVPRMSGIDLETEAEPADLAGDLLDAWLAEKEIWRLRRRAGSPDHRVAIASSKGMLAWVDFRRRMRREAPIAGDPRVQELLAALDGAHREIDLALQAHQRAVDALRAEVAAMLQGVVPQTHLPELPSVQAAVQRAIERALAARGRGLPT